MIHFEVDSCGALAFRADTAVNTRLADRHRRSKALLDRLVSGQGKVRLPGPSDVLARHPAAHALVAFQDGYVKQDQASALLSLLGRLDAGRIDRLGSGAMCVLQEQALLPAVDTRGESIRVDPAAPEDARALDHFMEQLESVVGEAWVAFRSIVNTVSLVVVPGLPDIPHFSGSTNDIWAAMHMTLPATAAIVAESVTHEAAHFWLHAVEEIGALAENAWTDERWVSPWREDPRPIAGIIHGVHVFSCAAAVLSCWLIRGSTHVDGPDERVPRRVATMLAQVEEGISEVRRCGRATPVGAGIVDASERRLSVPRAALPDDLLAAARENISRRRAGKIQRWSQRGLCFSA